jgi:hypothetical protein
MALLWDKPEDDDDFQMAEWLRENSEDETEVGLDYRYLCTLYGEIGNNGGANMGMTFFQERITRIEAVCKNRGIDCPTIFERDAEDPDFAEVVDLDVFDVTARALIRSLYASLNPEVQL